MCPWPGQPSAPGVLSKDRAACSGCQEKTHLRPYRPRGWVLRVEAAAWPTGGGPGGGGRSCQRMAVLSLTLGVSKPTWVPAVGATCKPTVAEPPPSEPGQAPPKEGAGAGE